jgi:hypothetical protein
MAAKLTRLTHKIEIQLHLVADLCHMQFSRQAVSPETVGYTLVYNRESIICNYKVQIPL